MEDGTTAALTEDDKKAVLGVVNEYSSKELRVLAIATQTFERMPFDEADEDLSKDRKFETCWKDLRLVGLVASIDPDRDGVPGT
jgi:magnesium-transporting ATPase (P-type)